jgi:hypothetical protein
MKRKLKLLVLAAILTGGIVTWQAATTHAFPEPNLAYRGWELQFDHSKPRAIEIKDATGAIKSYWYMTYKVTNMTKSERLFIPEITIATDAGDVFPANKDIAPSVFQAIKDETGNHLLMGPIRVVGKLLLGEDEARESVAIWPAFDHQVGEVDVFFSGISGEVQIYKDPVSGDSVNVKKSLMITYRLPGSGVRPTQQMVIPVHERWIMR